MKLSEIEKLTRKQLRERADQAFALAGEKGPAYLSQAEFYTRELDRRADSRTSIRDLILEIVVIFLIGGELYMSHQQSIQQDTQFKEQQKVLGNMEKSSKETLGAITAERQTMEAMNQAIQIELGLNYDVAVEITFDNQIKRIYITNKGKTNIYIWGDKIDVQKPLLEKKGFMVAPAGTYFIPMGDLYAELQQKMPKGSERLVPFVVYIKNENGNEFSIEAQLFPVWYNDLLTIHTQTTSVKREKWSGKGN